jgi:hypothetical protein
MKSELVATTIDADLSPDDARLFAKARLAMRRGIERHQRPATTIEMRAAAEMVHEENRLLADAWLTWPARLGPVIAAQLGADPEKVTSILMAHIQREVAQLGKPDIGAFDATA